MINEGTSFGSAASGVFLNDSASSSIKNLCQSCNSAGLWFKPDGLNGATSFASKFIG